MGLHQPKKDIDQQISNKINESIPKNSPFAWKYKSNASYSKYSVDKHGNLEFHLTPTQKKWMQQSFYNDFKSALGFQRWYQAVKDLPNRPSQRAMQQWYNSQEVNQRFKPISYDKKVKSIKAKKPFTLMQADSISLGKFSFGGWNYIFNVIDNYSGYAWSFPLKGKPGMTAKHALESMQEVLTQIKSWVSNSDIYTKDYPRIRLSVDSGSEHSPSLFAQPLKRWCIKNNIPEITIVYGKSNMANTQGQVERFNQTLQRSMMKRHYVSGFPKKKDQFPSWIAELLSIYNKSHLSKLGFDTPNNVIKLMKKKTLQIRNNEIDNKKMVKHKYPKSRLVKQENKLLHIGAKVRIVDPKWKKAALKGFLTYQPKASKLVYTISRHARKYIDRPLRVYISIDNKELKNSYGINELIVLPTNLSEDAPQSIETNTNTIKKPTKREKEVFRDLFVGKRVVFKFGNNVWYKGTIGKQRADKTHTIKFDDGEKLIVNFTGQYKYTNKFPILKENIDFKFIHI